MNVNLYVIEDYDNETAFRPQKNKPNSNPILSAVGGFRKAKMNLKSLAGKSGHTHISTNQKKFWTIPDEVVKIRSLDKSSISGSC